MRKLLRQVFPRHTENTAGTDGHESHSKYALHSAVSLSQMCAEMKIKLDLFFISLGFHYLCQRKY